MVRARRLRLLQHFYRRRHPLGFVVLAVFALELAAALGQCLMAATTQSVPAGTTTMANMNDHSNMASTMPCADCTMGSDSRAVDGATAIPADPKLWSVLALVLFSALLAINFPKTIPIPPRPLLPKRPRTLKFYALRI